MKNTEIFNRTTRKVYDLITVRGKELKAQGRTPPHGKNLDISIDKNHFNEDEWTFLIREEKKFSFHFISGFYPVYKIEDDKLFSNEVAVINIQQNYNERQ
jgi:hypothetical protein